MRKYKLFIGKTLMKPKEKLWFPYKQTVKKRLIWVLSIDK